MSKGVDLIFGMKVDNSDFVKKLKQSSEQVLGLKTVGNNVIGTLGNFSGALGRTTSGLSSFISVLSSCGKAAGVLGVAIGAVAGGFKLFSEAMQSLQTTGDQWNNTMSAASRAVDLFYVALNRGDFSYFKNGITECISVLKEYMDLKDSLGDAEISMDLSYQKLLNELAGYEQVILNPHATKAEKREAKTKWDAAVNTYKGDVDDTVEGYVQTIAAKFAPEGINMTAEDVEKYFVGQYNNNFSMRPDVVAWRAWKKEYQEHEKIANSWKTNAITQEKERGTMALMRYEHPDYYKFHLLSEEEDGEDDSEGRKETIKLLKDEIALLNKLNALLLRGNRLEKRVEGKSISTGSGVTPTNIPSSEDDVLPTLETIEGTQKVIFDLEKKQNSAGLEQVNIYAKQLKFLQKYLSLFKEGKLTDELQYQAIYDFAAGNYDALNGIGETVASNINKPIDGSLAYWEKKLAEIRKAMGEVSSPRKLQLLKKQEESVEEKIFDIKYTPGTMAYLKALKALLTRQLDNTRTPEEYAEKKAKIDSVDQQIAEYDVTIKPGSYADLQRQRAEIIKKLNNAGTKEEYIELQAQLVLKNKEINNFGLTKNQKLWGKSTTAIFNGLARSISGVGDAMRATGDEGKKMARTLVYVNLAASLANATAIMVEKTKSSATIWDWIAGFAAGTAAIISAAAQLNSINKYAEGGIVPGNNTIGDMTIARVNSGEMILNTRQQKNLFNLLNSNTTTASQPQEIIMKVKGKDLQGVLNNYNNKLSKLK